MNRRRLLLMAGGGFSPKTFGGLSVWLDASKLVGYADSDPVAIWPDLSGNGRNATAAAAARPTYKTGILNGKPILRFDGVQQTMATDAINLSAINNITMLAVVIPETTAASRIIMDLGTGAGTIRAYLYHSQDGGGNNNKFLAGCRGAVGFSYEYNNSVILSAPAVITGILDKSLATSEAKCYVNGNLAGTATDSNNLDTFENAALHIGSRNGATLWFKGDIAELILYNRAINSSERVALENYLLNKWTYNLPESIQDNAETDGYPSTFSRMQFVTSAIAFTVDIYNNILTAFPTYSEIGVFVDGVYSTVLVPVLDTSTLSISVSGLAAGAKNIELVNGLQSFQAAPRKGTWVRKVHLPTSASLSPTTEPAARMIVYGDSIAAGSSCTTCVKEGWPILVRTAYAATGGLAVEAWGWRSLYEDANTAPLLAAFVAKLGAAYPGADIIWLAIGTVDYAVEKWSSADFGTAYGALLDALNAQFPLATIYAQTPIERTSEVELHVGWGTLGDYRTAIGTAQSTRGAYCTLVDGTDAAFPQAPGDLADGVHPTTAGHALYGAAVIAVLGL